jgi:STAS domain
MPGEPEQVLNVAGVGLAADLDTVNALARLALAAQRAGCVVRLRGASPELLGLLELTGLADVLYAGGSE